MNERIAFIGGGNMASAIIGGLIKQGFPPDHFEVVEPFVDARQLLRDKFYITAHEHPGAFLNRIDMMVWAIKPQTFKEAALQVRAYARNALHLSVAAGISSSTIAAWLGSERVVRSMPNTPALIGLGITGLFARPGVSDVDRIWIERVVATMGQFLWVGREDLLDAVTAISASGPAYVYYFIEAMITAGTEMGLPHEQAYKLAVETFFGASALAHASSEPPEILRQRVTSKGGTTHAAISAMDEGDVKALFVKAMHAAERRARELGQEFGSN